MEFYLTAENKCLFKHPILFIDFNLLRVYSICKN